MANMAFGVTCVREFLAENGHVLTVRGYDYKSETATVRDLGGVHIKRTKVCEIHEEGELTEFLPLSSFSTTADWWRQIRRFCKGRMYLYRVELYDALIDKLEKQYEEREQRRARNQTIDDVPGFTVDRNAYRDENDPTTIEEYNIYDDMTHALDVRRGPALRDPALVDLTASKEQAHRDRIDADERAAEHKRERLREIYGEQMHAAPTQETHDPERIMRTSSAEQALKALCGNSYAA